MWLLGPPRGGRGHGGRACVDSVASCPDTPFERSRKPRFFSECGVFRPFSHMKIRWQLLGGKTYFLSTFSLLVSFLHGKLNQSERLGTRHRLPSKSRERRTGPRGFVRENRLISKVPDPVGDGARGAGPGLGGRCPGFS